MTLLFSFAGLAYGFLWFLLIVTILVLIAVILLQEGKGGGLAEAFGGAGAETFGVKAHGINKFTAVVASLFLILCIVLTNFRPTSEAAPLDPNFKPRSQSKAGANPEDEPLVPPENGGAQAPANGGGATPPGGGQPSTPEKPADHQ